MNRYLYSALKDIYIIALLLSCFLRLSRKAKFILLAFLDITVLILIFTVYQQKDLWFVIGCGLIFHLEAYFNR